jgi:hypothetical protein
LVRVPEAMEAAGMCLGRQSRALVRGERVGDVIELFEGPLGLH